MPSINNIDKFVQTLNSLGDEPRILEKRGEKLEPVKVPKNEPVEDNPFLVNIEDVNEEDTVTAEREPESSQVEDDLFIDADLDIDDIAPELEIDDSFDLGEIEDIGSEDVTGLEDLGEIEDIGSEDVTGLEDLGEIEDIGSEDVTDLEDLGEIEDIDSEDITGLEDLGEIEDIGSEDITGLEDLDNPDEVESPEEEEEPESPLEIEELNESELDIGEIDELEELSELSDEDLDTTPESLDDDLGIKDIDLDDIGLEEEVEEIEEEVQDIPELSIEDEVLEDDFGALEDDDSDEFSLGDFGDSFNFDKDASTTGVILEEFAEEEEEEEAEVKERNYTDEEFEKIQKTLYSLPLNLKIAIEEEIAENGLFGVKLEGLVNLLIHEASLKEILKYVNKTLGLKIKISPSFVKLTALDLEKKKQKFSYILINNVFPKLKWIFPAAIGSAALFLFGYFWGYKVIKSENIYKEGHELILIDKYEEAKDMFLKAFNTHRKMKWYYIYADTYHERKAFNYAEDIYLQILNEDSSELNAVLSYAEMKAFDEGEYAKAANFLLSYIDRGHREYEFMATLGDIYMTWGGVDPGKYEDARLWYSEIISQYGPKPPILFKHLNYLIITDKLDEVLMHRAMYEQEGSLNVAVNGDIYARMAGYLMEKNIVKDVRATIFRGLRDNPRNPNLHYQLAKYFTSIENWGESEKALRNAVFYYSYGGKLNADELSSLVDAKRMLGELYSSEERFLASERSFQEAVILYESLKERNFVEPDERYGEIYAGYGDIFYYAGNSLSTAYNLYKKAEENGFNKPEVSYKKGFINYVDGHMAEALEEFHKSEDIKKEQDSVMFAKANTLSYRGSYNSALTYYNMLLRYLQRLEDDNETLYPRENENHLAIIENYIRVYNNMGVTLYKLKGEKSLPEVGAAFTKSTEYYDYLTRDPELLIRSGSKDLSYYNTKAVLYPDKNMELLLYNSISRDFNDLNIGLVSVVGNEE